MAEGGGVVIPPPINEPWLPLSLSLTATDDGHRGTITIGGCVMHVRGWRKTEGGVVAEVQYPQDPAWEAVLEEVSARLRG